MFMMNHHRHCDHDNHWLLQIVAIIGVYLIGREAGKRICRAHDHAHGHLHPHTSWKREEGAGKDTGEDRTPPPVSHQI